MIQRLSFVLLLVTLLGCGSGIDNDPILRLSAQEALAEGRRLMEAKKYAQARKYLIHAFEVEPNSASGRDGLLLAADALFLQGGFDSYVEAEARYRDFINRFPTSDRADYAQLQVGLTLARRMEKPNRDQETTHKALQAFEDLIRIYPTSSHAAQAREEMETVRHRLAAHEYYVGFFYFRFSGASRTRNLAQAAINRFEGILEDYPTYPDRELVLYQLCRAHHRVEQPEKAAGRCSQLRQEFPESPLVKKADQLERQVRKRNGAPAEVAKEDGS